jgi:hypothetical protein
LRDELSSILAVARTIASVLRKECPADDGNPQQAAGAVVRAY